jgi:predicted PurR-regulated permease PerM
MQTGGHTWRLRAPWRSDAVSSPTTTTAESAVDDDTGAGTADADEEAGEPTATVPDGSWSSPRPPRWLWRALLMAVLAVFVGVVTWYTLRSLRGIGVNLLIALFVSLALEPMVVWLVRHGWRRGAATATTLFGALLVIAAVLGLFGNLFVQQAIQLVDAVPNLYEQIADWLQSRFSLDLPGVDELVQEATNRWGEDLASGALTVGSALVGGVFSFLTILLVTYYLVAAGPRFRAAVCRYLTPNRQHEVLRIWEITQGKVSDFINTRLVLAAISTVCTTVFLLILGTPYALPLALFTGVVSQFVPTIGTYIGGALPVLVALTSQSPVRALIVLAFIVAYQQVENLWLSPKVSARALEMNPAVAFVVVIAFGAVFGALGAFLALPIAATVQALWNTYIRRHELVESQMLHDPESNAAARRRVTEPPPPANPYDPANTHLPDS